MTTEIIINQTLINPIRTLWKDDDLGVLINDLWILWEIGHIKENISIITWWLKRVWTDNQEENERKSRRHELKTKEEIEELAKINNNIYKLFLNNLEKVLVFEWAKNVLIQVPSTHAFWFIGELIKRNKDKNSVLSKILVKYYIFDSESAVQIWTNLKAMERAFWYLIKEIYNVDKFVEIKDTTLPYKVFAENNQSREMMWEIERKYNDDMKHLWKNHIPRLKTYFPSRQQFLDDETSNSEVEFAKKFEQAFSMDVEKIREANNELKAYFDGYDEIEIKWKEWDIRFWIKWQLARNSWWDTNTPWAEVFSAPNKHDVNWWILFPNKNVIKMFNDDERVVKWLKLYFENWKLVNLSIESDDYIETKKVNIINRLNLLFDKNKANRYLWEIAFGTTPQVKPWTIIHQLIAEKAIWMHIALGNCYKYPEMDNWNHNADFHWDIIWSFENSEVYFIKWTKKVLVMKDWKFNQESLPSLAKYQNESQIF